MDFGVPLNEIEKVLHELAEYHGVVLHPNTAEIWIMHPFSSAPTNFWVRKGDRNSWGNCAWCSLGVAAIIGGDGIEIDTRLGAESQAITIHIDQHRVREDLYVHFPVPMTKAWDNVIYTCSVMLVFDSSSSVDDWCRGHAITRGDVRPIQQIYDFAQAWYGLHLEPNWKKWTIEEAAALFEKFGLDGPTWELRTTDGRF